MAGPLFASLAEPIFASKASGCSVRSFPAGLRLGGGASLAEPIFCTLTQLGLLVRSFPAGLRLGGGASLAEPIFAFFANNKTESDILA